MTLRERLVRWMLRGSSLQTQPVAPAVAEPDPKRISHAALWEARRTGQPAALPEQMLKRPVPIDGTLPSGMAMDDALPPVAAMSLWAMQSIWHEGLSFLGYPYLSELAQRAEYRKMAEIWAEHSTRRWVEWKGENDEQVNQLTAEMERLNVRAHFRESAEQDQLFGRSQLFLDFDDADKPAELVAPLLVDARKISKARPLKRLKNVEPMWSYPGPYNSSNPLNAEFYKPRHWYVYGKTISDTRFLTFVGREVPDMLKASYAFGGLSLTQIAKPYVDNWLRTRQSTSDLVTAFSQMVLKTDMSSVMSGGGGDDLYNRVDMANATRDNRGVWVINKDTEELECVAVPLSGLDKLQAQAQEQMASVSGIPLVILLGVTPSGLNASSDGEVRSFYATIRGYQEKTFRPNLARLTDVVCLSLFDKTAAELGITFRFIDLWEPTEQEVAQTRKTQAETDQILETTGAISNEEIRERWANDEGGPYHGLTGPAPEPDEDDDTDMPDDEGQT